MKQSMLKRALLTACLSVSMAGVAMAGPVGPVIIVKLSLFVSFAVSALSSNILLYTGNTNDELVPSTLNN